MSILRAHPNLRFARKGSVLIGGQPLRLVRLTEAGTRLVRQWLQPSTTAFTNRAPMPQGPRALAQKLVNNGMLQITVDEDLHLESDDYAAHHLAVVIPVKDDEVGLRASLAQLPPSITVVVVDDGSSPPLNLSDLKAATPASIHLVRSPRSQGPAAARNLGVRKLNALGLHSPPEFVCFLDAAVELPSGGLPRLLAIMHAYSEVTGLAAVAVAPRIAAGPPLTSPSSATSAITRFEQQHSPLDMGLTPSVVSPQHAVRYVPSTCLVVTGAAFADAGGFDESLRYGEDVDLIWRLSTQGLVLYAPAVTARHPVRTRLAAVASQRFGYGTAAAPLAKRHGSVVAPLVVSPSLTAIVGAGFLGRPLVSGILALLTVRKLGHRLTRLVDAPRVEASMIVSRSVVHSVEGLAQVLAREYLPVVASLAAITHPRPLRCRSTTTRRKVGALILWRWARKATTAKQYRQWPQHFALAAIDDIAYGLGVWAGVIKQRSTRALHPRRANDSVVGG